MYSQSTAKHDFAVGSVNSNDMCTINLPFSNSFVRLGGEWMIEQSAYRVVILRRLLSMTRACPATILNIVPKGYEAGVPVRKIGIDCTHPNLQRTAVANRYSRRKHPMGL